MEKVEELHGLSHAGRATSLIRKRRAKTEAGARPGSVSEAT